MTKFTPEFEEWFRKAMDDMRPEDKKQDPKHIDTKHFDRLTEQQKSEINKRAVSNLQSGKYRMT